MCAFSSQRFAPSMLFDRMHATAPELGPGAYESRALKAADQPNLDLLTAVEVLKDLVALSLADLILNDALRGLSSDATEAPALLINKQEVTKALRVALDLISLLREPKLKLTDLTVELLTVRAATRASLCFKGRDLPLKEL